MNLMLKFTSYPHFFVDKSETHLKIQVGVVSISNRKGSPIVLHGLFI